MLVPAVGGGGGGMVWRKEYGVMVERSGGDGDSVEWRWVVGGDGGDGDSGMEVGGTVDGVWVQSLGWGR